MYRQQPFEVNGITTAEGIAKNGSPIAEAAKGKHHAIAVQALATSLVHALAPAAGGSAAQHTDAQMDVTLQGAPESSQVAPVHWAQQHHPSVAVTGSDVTHDLLTRLRNAVT